MTPTKPARYIRAEIKSDNYRFFWIKYVRRFDQTVHCHRCLDGWFSKLVSYAGGRGGSRYQPGVVVEGALTEHDTPFVYLCGVSVQGWIDNLHIAMKPAPRRVIRYEDANVKVYVRGFKMIPIQPVPDAERHYDKSFTTCRNWQFGWQAFPECRVPFEGSPHGVLRSSTSADGGTDCGTGCAV